MKVVVKLVEIVLLIAGLFWSGVCVAQCRVLPPRVAKSSQQSKKKLPPCHQQQQEREDCKDEGCSVSYADAEKSFQVDIAVVAPLVSYLRPAVDLSTPQLIVERRALFDAPSQSISILRI